MPRRPASSLFTEDDDVLDADFVAGKEEAIEKVEHWVRSKVTTNPEIEGDVYLELAQLGAGSKMPIHSALVSVGDEPEVIAKLMVDAAVEDGSTTARGKTSYVVTIRDRPGRVAFAIEYTPRGDDEANETPNGQGLIAQALRHTEKMTNMLVQVVHNAQKETAAARREDKEEIRSLRSTQIETIQTFAALMDGKHARDLETRKLEKSEDRKDHVAGMLMQGIPNILNKVIGGKAVAETSTPLEQMLLGLLSTFKQEDLMRMMQTGTIQLQQEQMMGFLEIFRVVQEKFEAKQGQASQASAPRPTPAQNGAAGPATHAPASASEPYPVPNMPGA